MFEEDRPKFMSKRAVFRFTSLTSVPAYEKSVREPFDRCLDLSLCSKEAYPTCGGLVVSLLNIFQSALDQEDSFLKAVLKPILKAVAAAVTLGTGNSLGPEGPSVEIDASVANGVASLFDKYAQRKLSYSSSRVRCWNFIWFQCCSCCAFFCCRKLVLDLNLPLLFQTMISVHQLNFHFIFCWVVSLSFSWCTAWMMVATDKIQKTFSIPKAVFPVVGGFTVGLIALIYPEVLFWGFDNVDTLLESRPFVKGLPVDLLLQLLEIKIVATSFCRACGLVGGYYAPSLFICAAT